MTLRDWLYVMRRWRSVVMAGALIGVVVGWVSAPGTAVTRDFEATYTLVFEPRTASNQRNQAEVRATLGAVPDRVAARLGLDRRLVRSAVSAELRVNKGALLITGTSEEPSQAEALANVTAEELIVELGGQKAPFRTLEPAVAAPVKSVRGPTSRPGRALLLGGFGLFLGIGAAFGVDRFDNRIRSKRTAEEVLGVPVVAEVPAIPRSARDRLLSPTEAPGAFEAYRQLRTMVDRWRAGTDGDDGHRVIVVTSPIAAEGKTATVAHLAATLAEIGRSVLAISADLRRPRLHLYFERGREPGLVDALRGAPDVRRLTDLNLATKVQGVRFAASGAPVPNPAPLVERIGDLLHVARDLGDFVLVDSPALLRRSDAAMLAAHADGVLLVVRAGRTSTGAAARSVELLRRLDIPIIGAVLVGGDTTSTPSRFPRTPRTFLRR